MPEENKVFFEGFLIKMTLNNDRESKMDIIPYRQSDSKAGLKKMEEEYKRSFCQALNERSNAIKDDSYLQNQWIKFCERRKRDYLNKILGSNRLFRRLSAYRFFFNLLYTRKSLIRLQNTILCESHRDVLETLFKYHLI
jgi:poly-gamma-glutamate synthesis protein (capsule biosynthesis protein)